MSVVVRVPTVLRAATGGAATVPAASATVREVFDDLVQQFPGLRTQVLADDGSLHRHLNVFLNDDDIRYIGKLDAKVSDDDTITLMPAVAGGALPWGALSWDARPWDARPWDARPWGPAQSSRRGEAS